MKVLITGGAGYIGSHTCLELLISGHEVFVIDDLSNGHIKAIETIKEITNCDFGFMKADIRNTDELDKVFNNFKPDAVIHFAGLKAVGESVSNPLKYYDVNVTGTVALLKAMSKTKCQSIIFSSSATVYGDPQYLPYDELHPTCPVSPYGRTKLIIENLINDWIITNKKHQGVILRYFNPVGAHQSGKIGEEPNGVPNNLMPFIAQVAVGRRDCLEIYGNDYDTIDGTGLRDYIHVVDLANAHVKALELQSNFKAFEIINIGRGRGTTVLEIVKSFENISRRSIKYKFSPRRSGDLPAFWADASKAFNILNWKAKYSIDEMCEDTWRWQNNKLNE